MNESFANFSAFQLMKRYDTKNYDSYYDLCKKKAELPGPVATAENFKPNTYDLFYFKGAFLLLELENKIGEQQMIKLLEERVSKKINNTSGFLRALEQIAGKKNRLYFEELISK
jgi:aminopeptidase N